MFGIKSTRSLNKKKNYQNRSDHKVDTSDTDNIIHSGLNKSVFLICQGTMGCEFESKTMRVNVLFSPS